MIVSSGKDTPPTPSDRKMSVRHAADSVRFNLRHARDHMRAARIARQRLARVRRG